MNTASARIRQHGDDSIDVAELLPLSKVTDVLGTRPHKDTLRRWASRGLFGVHLRTIHVGATTCTTVRWVEDFIRASSKARNDLKVARRPKPPTKRRQRSPLSDEESPLRTADTLRRHNVFPD